MLVCVLGLAPLLWLFLRIPIQPSQFFEKISQLALEAVTRYTVRSAMYPVLWLCVFLTPTGLGASIFLKGAGSMIALMIAAVPVALFVIAYLYFMFKDPSRLQSEQYQLRNRALDIIQEKANGIELSSQSLESISNPDLPRLQ
jgi:hypothetical protein